MGVAAGWGFSVDDALISARVAHHIATGFGYRFNAGGPVVDCVTPLGWAFLLAPAASGGAWQGMTWASGVGGAVWVLAALDLGRRCGGWCSGWRFALLALALGSCLPLGAWAVSGMETGVVMALGVGALGKGRLGAACAGAAAALRPELLPWAVTLAFGSALARRQPIRERVWALALALAPALLVGGARWVAFGEPVPLAVYAKPSDAEHGLRYALGSLLLTGPPYLLLAGKAWRRLPRAHCAIGVALLVHWLVLLGVGGDWMPFWRLAMPTFPGVLLVGAALLERSHAAFAGLRLAGVFACAALLHWGQGSATRVVRADRSRMIAELAPLLTGARRVASVDVGWVGAAGAYEVIDLGGVTDPEIAYLPGGHTSKRLPPELLERRDVDAMVLLLGPSTGDPATQFARRVEERAMRLRGAERFMPVGRVQLNPRQDYVVLRQSAQGPAP